MYTNIHSVLRHRCLPGTRLMQIAIAYLERKSRHVVSSESIKLYNIGKNCPGFE